MSAIASVLAITERAGSDHKKGPGSVVSSFLITAAATVVCTVAFSQRTVRAQLNGSRWKS